MCVTRIYIHADDLHSTDHTLVFLLCPSSSSSSTSSSLPSEWLSVVEGSSGSEAALGLKGTFQPGQTHSGLAAWLRNMGHRLTLGGPCRSQPSGALQHTWKWKNKVDVPLPTATARKSCLTERLCIRSCDIKIKYSNHKGVLFFHSVSHLWVDFSSHKSLITLSF